MKSYYYLSFIIFIEIFILIGYIQIKTTPYYDEIWTYGLANSKNKPFLYDLVKSFRDSDGGDLLYNRWLSGEYYSKYITVQPDDRFDFKNVYDNQTLDFHPPLYYYLLHFICSFFPNKFSLWYGYSINILFLILTQLILFKIGLIIFNNEKWAFINCAFFALSMGAVNEFIYIRMYAALSFSFLAITYLALDICSKETITRKDLIKVIIISFLGFLTENQFYYYVFALTISCLAYFFYKKNYRLLVEFFLSGILSLLVFWNYFPWIFVQSQRFDDYYCSKWEVSNFFLKPFPIKEFCGNISIINNYIWGLDTGLQMNFFKYIRYSLNDFINYIPVWLSIIILFALLFALFFRKGNNYKFLIFLFTFFIYLICLSANTFFNRSLWFFGLYTFSILPCFSIIFFYLYRYLIFSFITRIKIQKILFALGIVVFVLASHCNSDKIWCCDLKPGTEKICEFLNNKNVIYVVDSNVLVDVIIHAKPWDFMKAKKVFASRSHEIDKIIKSIKQLPSGDECILFIPNSLQGKKLYNEIVNVKNVVNISFIGVDNVQACSFYMFLLKT